MDAQRRRGFPGENCNFLRNSFVDTELVIIDTGCRERLSENYTPAASHTPMEDLQ
jgi:hypothetical protein